MNIDKLFQHDFVDSASSSAYDVGYGHLNGIAIVGTTLSSADTIDIKLRTNTQTYVLATRLSLGFVATQSDMNYGVRSRHGIGEALRVLDEEDAVNQENFGDFYPDFRMVYLPLGSISLENAELEVSITNASRTGGVSQSYSLYKVSLDNSPMRLLQYDETKDFDSTHDMVREIYFSSGNPIFEDGVFRDLEFRIDTSSGTLINDSQGALLGTNVFSRAESIPENRYVRLYTDDMPVPTSVRFKVVGQNGSDSVIYIKEIVPELVKYATVETAKKLMERIEKLPDDLQKNYRRLDARVKKVEELQSAINQAENANKQDDAES